MTTNHPSHNWQARMLVQFETMMKSKQGREFDDIPREQAQKLFNIGFRAGRNTLRGADNKKPDFTCVRCGHECSNGQLINGEACPSCKLV